MRPALIVLLLACASACTHKRHHSKIYPDPASFEDRRGMAAAKAEAALTRKWPQNTRYIFTTHEAHTWTELIRDTKCQKLILGYLGGDSPLPGYGYLDITAIIDKGDFGSRLLEYARVQKLRPVVITTFEPQLVAIMLDQKGRIIAALTQNDGFFQPVRMGRYRSRWVFDHLFWKQAWPLRFEAQTLAKEMRRIAEENGPNEWDSED